MTEIEHSPQLAETVSSPAYRFEGLTKDDVPPEVTVEAGLKTCPNHPEPDSPSRPGYGYAGGGFGPYRICRACDTVFGKVAQKDGNETK